MSLHPERPVLFRTSVDFELDLEDCPGFSVQIGLMCDRLLQYTPVFHYMLYREPYTHSLIYHHKAF